MKEFSSPQDFLVELRRIGVDAMVNYYLLEGVPAYFTNKWEGYCSFKEEIAIKLNVHPKTVMLVGSARWGFSTSPEKFPRKFDEGEKQSDLDVVIADSALFDRAWRELCEHEMDESPKRASELFSRRRHMLYRGQLNPIIFPDEAQFRKHWKSIFDELSQKSWGEGSTRMIEAWIFKDWQFVQGYYRGSFKQILDKNS